MTHDCGPLTAGVPHGHTYVVAMTWTYSRDQKVSTGSTKGSEFAF
jgi:hypothetical protein